MNRNDPSHDEAFAALEALALDALDARARDAVLAHVAWCTECRDELKRLRAVASQLAFVAPVAAGAGAPSVSRERTRARLMARASAEGTLREVARHTPVSFPVEAPVRSPSFMDVRTWRPVDWFALAASLLLVASLTVLAVTINEGKNLRQQLALESTYNGQTVAHGDSLERVIAARDSMLASLLGREVAIMRLTSAGARAPFALMFWDRVHNAWTFTAHNMPPLKTGRTYQLWLVTATAKISAGTFDPKDGDAVLRAKYPLAPDALRAVAVTEEKTGGAIQPTSDPIIAVSAQ